MSPLLDAALAYGRAGLPVLALIPGGKTPAITGGFHSATTDPETIKRMWRIPDRNIGVATGAASGTFVIDCDWPDGEDNLGALQAEHGELPATRASRTPNRGRHMWFRYPGPIPSTANRIARHVDVRCDLGYICVPPSVTPIGAYTWCGSGVDAELATAPDWLVDLARKRPSISERALAGIARPMRDPTAYGRAALEAEIRTLATTFSGGRNAQLNRVTFKLFQLVGSGELPESGLVEQLIAACHANGYIGDDGLFAAMKTIRSARAAGLKNPRYRKRGAR
jgi:hypothetical protein